MRDKTKISFSKFAMLRDVASGLVESAKGRILRNSSSFYIVSMMVHQIAILGLVKKLARASVFSQNTGGVIKPPEVEKNRFEELVVDH